MSKISILEKKSTELFLESIDRLNKSCLTVEQHKDLNFIVEFCIEEIAKSNKLVDSAHDSTEKAVVCSKEAITAFKRIESKFYLMELEQSLFSGVTH